MTDGPPRVIAGRYRLDRILGRGGMGAVWQATDTLLERDVAIKEIFIPGADSGPVDPEDPRIQRAMREAKAAARLRHPGIVAVHDVALDADRPWIVMELVGGPSLADVIAREGSLSPGRAAGIGLQVLDALNAAHRQGTVHRDVKPANILIDPERALLTDFGIAAVDDGSALTVTGQMVGSPAYMAPERINGQPAAPAADLWALGITLYAAVTGRSPFQREDTQATIMAILTAPPPVPSSAGHLWPVIAGLLEKDAARRLTAEQARPMLAAAATADETVRYTPPAPTLPAPAPTPISVPAPVHRPGPPGLLPADFPVQLVELTMGDRTGYTLRVYVPENDGWATPVFTSAAGRLQLVPRPEQAAGFALSTREHDLSGVPHWDWLAQTMSQAYLPLLDENRYDLGIPVASLEMEPARWLPDLMVKTGKIANELMLALDIEEIFPLLGAGAPLDQFDDSLSQAGGRPRRNHIRQWEQLNRGQLAAWWQYVADVLETRLDWRG